MEIVSSCNFLITPHSQLHAFSFSHEKTHRKKDLGLDGESCYLADWLHIYTTKTQPSHKPSTLGQVGLDTPSLLLTNLYQNILGFAGDFLVIFIARLSGTIW